jgi:hypothetical protein
MPSMLSLSIFWLVLGLGIGALAIAARPRRARSGPVSGRFLLLIGALAGLTGGWLGTLLFGRFYGTATAAWIAVLAVALLTWVAGRRSTS